MQVENLDAHAAISRLNYIASQNQDPNTIEKLVKLLKSATLDWRTVEKYIGPDAWTREAARRQAAAIEDFEARIKSAKTSMSKDPLREAHMNAGDVLFSMCDYPVKDFCSSSLHVVEMSFAIIRASVLLGNFSHVSTYVAKIESLNILDTIVVAKLNVLKGLIHLDQGNHKAAAKSFLDSNFSVDYSHVLSHNSIAIYGGLCALASFDRRELKQRVISNANFKQFLEIEPEVRDIIYFYYNSKYTACLDILKKKCEELNLDLFLHRHITKIYENTRKKALVQYFSTFLSVDMNQMALTFGTPVKDLEAELVTLIDEDAINCRIDSHNKQSDLRSGAVGKCLEFGKEYERRCEFLEFKLKLQKANLFVEA